MSAEDFDDDLDDLDELEAPPARKNHPARRPARPAISGSRGNGYLLTGLVLGLILGLVYSLALDPLQYSDAAPAQLNASARDAYRKMIAYAYLSNADLPRARARLELLGDADPAQALAAQAQRGLAGGVSPEESRVLSALASALLGNAPAPQNNPAQAATPGPSTELLPSATVDPNQAIQTATIAPTPTVTLTPVPTFTPRPTATQAAALRPFTLQEQTELCDPAIPIPLLQVWVTDASGAGLAGVRVTVSWEGGESAFTTGLYPQQGPGYADFEMKPGVAYALRAGDASETVSNLSIPACEGGSGGWRVVFVEK